MNAHPSLRWWWSSLLALIIAGAILAGAADPLPPKPSRYVSDAAGILSPQVASALNARLEAFEKETSNQVIVATFPKVPENFALEDFTQRAAEAWGAGQGKNDNGVVLFVFPNDRRTRIEVGYGLEGALPDVVAKRIIENEILPAFRTGDFDTGISRGVNAILQATRGEYRGSGRTNADTEEFDGTWLLFFLFILVIFVMVAANQSAMRRGAFYGPRGRRTVWTPPMGGGWSRGGGSFGGGGGFRGGGGSFGCGGASGRW
jgi:uncharacterized protein